MLPMSPGLFLKLFSSWQLIVVCAGIMFLLPLIFYLASRRPARPKRLPRPMLKIKPRQRSTPKPQAGDDKPESDEVEFKELK
jgi:hypothetical protein